MDPDSFTKTSFFVESPAGNISETDERVGISLTEGSEGPNSVAEMYGLSLSPLKQYAVTITSAASDVAGFSIGELDPWTFNTGDSTDETAPEEEVRLLIPEPNTEPPDFILLPYGVHATRAAAITISIDATDDYNDVTKMKFWGDSNDPLTYPELESDAAWENIITLPTTKTWVLPATPGAYYILSKFMDRPQNISPAPNTLKVIFDNEVPLIDQPLEIDGGATYTNHVNTESDSKVTLTFVASDVHTGVEKMWISNSDTFADGAWADYSSLVEGWILPPGDGVKNIYVKVRDHLHWESATSTSSITLDLTPPSIIFDRDDSDGTTDILNVNTATAIGGIIDDTLSGIASYSWDKESGPGNLFFNTPSSEHPITHADADGTYYARVTVTDYAGNVAVDSIDFIWDETPPDNAPVFTSAYYANSATPIWSWDAVNGADYYKVSVNNSLTDWNNAADYLVEPTVSFSPSTALSEGENILRATAWDDAGNSTAESDSPVFVDTQYLVITPPAYPDGSSYLTKDPYVLDFSGSAIADPAPGSGLDYVEWSSSDAAKVSFSDTASRTPTVTATEDGSYSVYLKAVDLAGNETDKDYPFTWDTTPPSAPILQGPDNTMNSQPTWSWSTGGGGNGTFSYVFTARDGSETPLTNTDTSFQASDQSAGVYTLTLTVQERDDAGNWSSIVSKTVNVDTTTAQPPFVSGPDVTNDTTPVWTWVTGAEQDPGTYQYRLDGSAWSADTSQLSFEPASPLSDGQHTLEVQEFYAGEWKSGSKTITIDTVGPTAPSVSGPARTNDTTPTWTWTGDAVDGDGVYQFRLSGAPSWTGPTTATSYTPALSEGSYTLEVQEQDYLGNWSVTGSSTIEVDTTPPTLNSIVLAGDAKYTNTANVTATISAVSESGMQMSFYDYNPSGWKAFVPYSSSYPIQLPDVEGTRSVYVRLMDDVGNITAYSKDDSIILDKTPPSITSFLLNSGDTDTPSLRGKINVNGTDNYWDTNEIKLQQSVRQADGTYNDYAVWYSYSTSITTFTDFDKAAGTKYVRVRLKDGAGNISDWYTDSIYLQIPTLRFAYKGAYPTYTYIYYNGVSEPSGDYVTRYYFYYFPITEGNTNVTLPDPNNGGSVNYHTYTTDTSSANLTLPPGELRYYWVRAYNADSGGWGPFTQTSELAFASNITVIYDDDDSTDYWRAQSLIKPLLRDDAGIVTNYPVIYGTMPTWTITLLPEDYIETTYSSYNRIYGDPIIVTPGTKYVYSSSAYDDEVRNIASSYRPVIGMGVGGGSLLDRIATNWATWGLSGTAPADIGYSNSAYLGTRTTVKTRPAVTSDYIWFTPVYYDYLYNNYYSSSATVTWWSSPEPAIGIYRSGATAPSDGSLYVGDPTYSNYFPVVRQGRYLFYGYDRPPYFYYYGYPLFINLVAKMDNY